MALFKIVRVAGVIPSVSAFQNIGPERHPSSVHIERSRDTSLDYARDERLCVALRLTARKRRFDQAARAGGLDAGAEALFHQAHHAAHVLH